MIMASTVACHRPHLPDFILTDKLGSGTYATVYKAYRKSSTARQVVAIKCVTKASLNRVSTENLLTEIELLKTLRHEHIVELKDFEWDDEYIYLVMEYCGGGDLSRFIQQRRILPQSVAKLLLQQLASALQYMRSKNVSHMDLKPQNILLSSAASPVLKIADFGFAHYLLGETDAAHNLRGSLLYMAPELLTRQQYNEKADLWSVGIILYECLFGRAPFASKSVSELEDYIYDTTPIEIPHSVHISSDCRSLLTGLLQRNPNHRISYDDFLNHPFVDLEHRPCAEALQKATELVQAAVHEDAQQQYQRAVELYCQAVAYFIPAIHYEADVRKKRAIRDKVKDYISRAEQLKQLLKPKHETSDGEEMAVPDELVALSSTDHRLNTALHVVRAAQDKEKEDDFASALDNYKLALELLINLLHEETAGRRRELLQAETSRWLSRAELIKNYLRVRDLPAGDVSQTEQDTSSFVTSTCSVQ